MYSANCVEGSFRSKFNNCTLCEQGYYQDEKYQTSCKKCPKEKNTDSPGAKLLSDCNCKYNQSSFCHAPRTLPTHWLPNMILMNKG